MTTYLCYDLKGIQSFIFAVPRLKFICGGSALIDRFDREILKNITVPGTRCLFSGGGKGAFICESDEGASLLRQELIQAAHREGLDICFGQHADYNEAANLTDQTYPFLPEANELDGHPCEESGLFPVSRGKVHESIQRRTWQKGDRLDRYFENRLLQDVELEEGASERAEFFHDVSAEEETGFCGAAALGNRNRWAVIAMDGNDMGSQHRDAGKKFQSDAEAYGLWLGKMSQALDECSHQACRQAIHGVVNLWAGSPEGKSEMTAATSDGTTTLPIRPLLVGGDDIIVLCHVRYAMDFVRKACEVFESTSEKLNEEAEKDGTPLWLATGGKVTISAGVLFAPVTLPLATAIPYAEQLLRSAKSRGRQAGTAGEPAPASLDWESVTEGLLESMPSRRQSELRFFDKDINEIIELTQRPYTLQEFCKVLSLVEGYREIPNTIRHRLVIELQAAYWDRRVACGRLSKTHGALVRDLEEEITIVKGRWRRQEQKQEGLPPIRSTDVIDALLLLEEDQRINRQTIGA